MDSHQLCITRLIVSKSVSPRMESSALAWPGDRDRVQNDVDVEATATDLTALNVWVQIGALPGSTSSCDPAPAGTKLSSQLHAETHA